MRSLCTAVLTLAVILATMPVQAATVLSDQQIDRVRAGQPVISGFAINDVEFVTDSALAIQSNIGAVVSNGMCNVASENTNKAVVNNTGNSALALQSNIGAVVGTGDFSTAQGAVVDNSNCAIVTNQVSDNPVEPGIDAVNVSVDIDGLFTINDVSITASAAAFQNNIGAIVTEGGIKCSLLSNRNRALAINNGLADCSAAVAQNNIGAIVSLDAFINGALICNSNIGGAINGLAIFGDGDMDNLPDAQFDPMATTGAIDSWNEIGNGCLSQLRLNPAQCPDIEGPDITGTNLAIDGLLINAVDPVDSAVVEQNNIGVAYAQTCVIDTEMANKNLALAVNVGNAAAALQNNIGVLFAEEGLVSGSGICNLNGAIVANITGCEENEEPGIDTENINFTFEDDGLTILSPILINNISITNSAAAQQNNIAVIYAEGNIECSWIDQVNAALVINLFGDSAFALQSNIGAMYTSDCLISNVSMDNCNLAAVANLVGCPPENGAVQTGSNISLGEDLFLVNPITISLSAAAVQSNIGAILTSYLIDGAWMSNTNKAFVLNYGNSAAAVQSNIGAILTEFRINGAHIDNANCAEIENNVTVPTDEALLSAITTTNISLLPINPPTFVQAGAYAQQSNIAAIYAPDTVTNSCVSNFNSACVSNSISDI